VFGRRRHFPDGARHVTIASNAKIFGYESNDACSPRRSGIYLEGLGIFAAASTTSSAPDRGDRHTRIRETEPMTDTPCSRSTWTSRRLAELRTVLESGFVNEACRCRPPEGSRNSSASSSSC